MGVWGRRIGEGGMLCGESDELEKRRLVRVVDHYKVNGKRGEV
jgi:hypothetical protein